MFHKSVLLVIVALLIPLHATAQTENDLFDGNTLHEIRLEINPGDWAHLKDNFRENTYYACEFHWISNGEDITTPEVAVRSRGQGSRSGVKPSLKIEFDRYESKQSFLGLKNLVLRANTQDTSMMHERVSMEFLRKMGLRVPREAHAMLYVNGEYAGLYTIVEEVDKPFLRTNFGEDSGYLYSYQYQDPYFFEDRGPNPATYSPIPFQPEFTNQVPNPAPISAMIEAINHVSDEEFPSAVSQFIDLKEFLTELAIENFLAEQDGLIGYYGLNNFFLYRFAGTNLHIFIPWDKSNTFFSLNWPIMRNVDTNVLSRRALAVPELLAFYQSELTRAAEMAGGPGGWLEQEIDKEYQLIRDAAYADTLKVCDPEVTGNLRPCTNEEFDASVADMRTFAERRSQDVIFQVGATPESFTLANEGGFTSTAAGSGTPLKTGYARIQRDERGVIINDAYVPEAPLIQSGRIYAQIDDIVKTGLAIGNPNDQTATLSFYFTDGAGSDFGSGTAIIPPNGQIRHFLDDSPFNGKLASGTFTFTSSLPVAAIALRGSTNERSEFLVTAMPIVPIRPQPGNLTLPYFVDGGGWTSEVILLNPEDQLLTGSLQFFSQGSNYGPTSANIRYAIPPRASFRLRTPGNSTDVTLGSVRIVPAVNSGTPAGVGIFEFRNAGVTVTETTAEAIRTSSAFRLYTEWSGDFAHREAGSIQTGIAVANSGATAATVNFELTNLDGTPLGLTGRVTVPANGQSTVLLNQVPGFEALPVSFRGVLRVSGPPDISVVGLRGHYNERGDFLVTTLPALAEGR